MWERSGGKRIAIKARGQREVQTEQAAAGKMILEARMVPTLKSEYQSQGMGTTSKVLNCQENLAKTLNFAGNNLG